MSSILWKTYVRLGYNFKAVDWSNSFDLRNYCGNVSGLVGGKVRHSPWRKMSATLSSAVPEVAGCEVTFRKLEEELLEGCNLQHGEMTANDITIHFVETGDAGGKLVILIHGFPNFWYVWKYQFQPLVEAGYHVIAPDLRGYNDSSKPQTVEQYSRSFVLSDLVKLIDHFGGGKRAIVVGHDWGAAISWGLAEDYPTKVEKLVTTNMGRPHDFWKILKSNIQQLRKSWYIGFFQIPFIPEWCLAFNNARGITRGLKSSCSSATEEDLRRHAVAYSRPGATRSTISYYRAGVRGLWSFPDGKVPVVDIPVTVLWGDQDPFLLPIIAETNKAEAPKTKIVHLPKCGHWPMWDAPSVFNELLIKAISESEEHYSITTN